MSLMGEKWLFKSTLCTYCIHLCLLHVKCCVSCTMSVDFEHCHCPQLHPVSTVNRLHETKAHEREFHSDTVICAELSTTGWSIVPCRVQIKLPWPSSVFMVSCNCKGENLTVWHVNAIILNTDTYWHYADGLITWKRTNNILQHSKSFSV